MKMIGEEGLLIDILSRLPVKSLLQFKSVCKQWRSLISDPHFAQLQLRRSLEHSPRSCRGLLWLGNPIRSIDCEDLSCSADGVRVVKHPSIICPESFIEIAGSCNGLVCLIVCSKRFILWNPMTGACDELPSPSPDFSEHEFFYGFGYDASTYDYKLLRGSSTSCGSRSGDTVIDILSCKTNFWRRITYESIPYVTSRGHFLNESLHWLAGRDHSDSGGVIVSFDVANEKFGALMCPLLLDNDTVLGGLMIVEDCLFAYENILTDCDGLTFVGWILRDYQMKSSWTKFCSFLIGESPAYDLFLDPLWFRKDGKVIFHLGNVEVTIFDRDKGTGDCLKIGEYSLQFDHQSYVESLISPFSNYSLYMCKP